MTPAFRMTRRLGIGIFVPPSAAEPWISGHPAILQSLERLDRIASRPLAIFGDHVLYRVRAHGRARSNAAALSRRSPAKADRSPRIEFAVTTASAASRFRSAYGAHRASEGRDLDPVSMRQLPYLAAGPLARQWAVRARTFDAFVEKVLRPMARAVAAPASRARSRRRQRLAELARSARRTRSRGRWTFVTIASTDSERPRHTSIAQTVVSIGSSRRSSRFRSPAAASTSSCSTRRCTTPSILPRRCVKRAG